jgi:uncharacterized protein YkwD
MTRSKSRRSLQLECLESRELLNGSGPTADQQYMLQLVNMARTNPTAMVTWLKSNLNANDMATIAHYGVNLDTELSEIGSSTPVQPLAWNATLASTAQSQSQYEADNQIQTHQGPGELNLEGRLDAAGYTNRVSDGENSYAYAQSVDHAMKAFLIDWGVPDKGHRGNLLQPNTADSKTYAETGIGIVATNPGSAVGPYVITQDFGRQASYQPQVLGVVYKDNDGNNFYTPGEGQGGLTVEVDDSSGNEVAQTKTWASGGYQLPLTPGSYTVKVFDANGNPVQYKDVTIGTDNVEADFNLNQAPSIAPVVKPAVQVTKATSSAAPQGISKGTSSPTVTVQNVSKATPTPTVTAQDVSLPVVLANLKFSGQWQNAWFTWSQQSS